MRLFFIICIILGAVAGVFVVNRSFDVSNIFNKYVYIDRLQAFSISIGDRQMIKGEVAKQALKTADDERLNTNDFTVFIDGYIIKLDKIFATGVVQQRNTKITNRWVAVKLDNWQVPYIGQANPQCIDVVEFSIPRDILGCVE